MERETVEAYALGTVGAVLGVYEVFYKDLKPSTKAWGALVMGVIAYDLLCKEGETLSEGMDHFIEKHPVISLGAIAVTAGHLSNIIPEQYDPIHRLVSHVR